MTGDPVNKILLTRPPRVCLTYRADCADPSGQIELPFVLGVLADLSGHPETPLPLLLDRGFVDIDIDNFETVLARIAPQLTFSIESKLAQPTGVHLRFRALSDFSPESIAAQIPALAEMLECRRRLNQLRQAVGESERFAVVLEQAMSVEDNHGASISIDQIISSALLSGVSSGGEEHARRLLQVFRSELRAARPLSYTDPEVFLNERIRVLDRHLSSEVNAILHCAPFQQLEAAWRGLYYLVGQTETGPNLKIRVLNISKNDLRRDLLRASSFDTSVLFKKVHDDIHGSLAGQPFTAFIVDSAFGPQPQDVQILSRLSDIGAAIHAPWITASGPEMFDVDNFAVLRSPRGFAHLFEGAIYASWRRFRESENSRYIALALPRVLLRLPYGCTGQTVESFAFEEDIFPNKPDHYLWGNAAYAFGTCLTAAFSKFGWCAAISGASGGMVEGLPFHFLDPSDEGATGPLEISFNEKQELDLAKFGFLALSGRRGAQQAAFFTAQSCYQPKADEGSTAAGRLFSRLDYLLCASRFAHYVRCLFRDTFDPKDTPAQWETLFNEWISQYVLADGSADIHERARRPLRQARIEVIALPGKPNSHAAVWNFHPHFQLEDPPVAYRVVAVLPQIRGAN